MQLIKFIECCLCWIDLQFDVMNQDLIVILLFIRTITICTGKYNLVVIFTNKGKQTQADSTRIIYFPYRSNFLDMDHTLIQHLVSIVVWCRDWKILILVLSHFHPWINDQVSFAWWGTGLLLKLAVNEAEMWN